MDSTYPLVPVANFIAFSLILVTLSFSSTKSWNTGVHLFAFWVAIECLIRAVNSILWARTSSNLHPIWCDITTHIDTGATVGLAACSLVITRRLFLISRLRNGLGNKRNKRYEIIFDLVICAGIPVVVMTLYYVVQAARFQILEEFGCTNLEAASILSLLLVNIWSVVLPMISAAFYCPRIILTFHRQRKEIKALSGTEHTSQTSYTRIMILGCADAMITLPINFTGFLIIAFQNKLDFWPGWSSVHSSFDVIPEVSSQVWRSSSLTRISVQWTEWIYVCLSLLFFGLFGCTRDARRRYVRAIWTIMSVFGRKKPAEHELSTVSFNPGPYNTTNGTLNTVRSNPERPHAEQPQSSGTCEGLTADSWRTGP